jgi:hypothetical protein
MYTKELTNEFGRVGEKFLNDLKSGWLDDKTIADMKAVVERYKVEQAANDAVNSATGE